MISSEFSKRATLSTLAALTLFSCSSPKSDLPSLAPATQVVVTNYAPAKIRKAGAVTTWTITNPQQVLRLVKLADAQGKGWRDANAANISDQTGITLKLTGGGVNQIFTIQPNGFDNSYNTASGNLWSRPDSVGPSTLIKLIPDAELDKLVADIRAVLKGAKPDPTPKPTATPRASK